MAHRRVVTRYGATGVTSPVERLVSVALKAHAEDCEHHDLEVEHQCPVLDVVDIVNGPIDDGRRASQVIDLGPTAKTWPDLLPLEIARHFCSVTRVEEGWLRSRADQAHISLKHVPQLGQLVHAE